MREGILHLKTDELVFDNGKMVGSKSYKQYLKVPYQDIYCYANVLYGMEPLPWKGKPEDKPSEKRCFRFSAKLEEKLTDLYFCVYKKRQSWNRNDHELSKYQAIYLNDLWVATFNQKLHLYNLKISKEKMMRTVKKIDCNAHIMEDIKYEYRVNYLNFKHKVMQLVDIKKFNIIQGQKIIDSALEKLKYNACAGVRLCTFALEICHKKQQIPLRYKGYNLSWTLQNPYKCRVPKFGIEVREYPAKTIGLEIVKMAEELTGLKPTQGNIVTDMPKYYYPNQVGSKNELSIALNTLEFFFKGSPKIMSLDFALRWVTRKETIRSLKFKRKVNMLAMSTLSDPFFELLGFIRDKQLTNK